jgi:hypothetical protein
MNMKQMILPILALLILTSPVIAGDDKTTVQPTTSETRTHYQFHSDPDPKQSGWTTERDRVYNYEITDSKGNKSTARPTTSETRSNWQFHSDPDPKKSGWKFEQDRVYNYEIKGGNHTDSWKNKSDGKRR